MEVVSIDTYVKRQKEIFDAYIESNGKKSAIIPFVEKYSSEDSKDYSIKDVLKYIKLYINSNLIKEEEAKKFNGTKKVSNKVIFNRGKLLVQKLIESKGDFEELSKYTKEFAKADDRMHPYPASYLDTCRDYYLSHTKNIERLENYKRVMSLASRGDEYDIELINTLLEMDRIEKAVNFVKEINISKSSLVGLRQKYRLLYPANKKELSKINEIIDLSFRTNEKVIKFIDRKQTTMTNQDKIKIIKRMIEDYLLSDYEDISELFPKYNFNKYKFKETLKDAKTSRDIILNNLINNYYAKSNAIKSEKQEILNKLINAYDNGINYGNGFRSFNSHDFYLMINGNKVESLLEYAKDIYDSETLKKLKKILESFSLDKVYKTKSALINAITKFTKNGRELSDEEKELIIDYMEYTNLPYSSSVFFECAERYFDNDIKLTKDHSFRRSA